METNKQNVVEETILLKDNDEKQPISIPNTEQINSSPEITLGQDTLNMVDEFMKNEEIEKIENQKGNIFKRIAKALFCCNK